MQDLETKTVDDETERSDTNSTEVVNDEQPSEIKQISSEENKNISKTNESNESSNSKLIPPSEMSDLTSYSSEGNNSASLAKDSYKCGPTPSVFCQISKEQCKINLFKVIENIRKGYEYLCITKLYFSDGHDYYFYSSKNKFNPNNENYAICFESYYRRWVF